VLEPDSDQTKALRALTRAREDLVVARVAMANQLRAELERFWPGPVGLFADLDSPISLAFLARRAGVGCQCSSGDETLLRSKLSSYFVSWKRAKRRLRRAKRGASG